MLIIGSGDVNNSDVKNPTFEFVSNIVEGTESVTKLVQEEDIEICAKCNQRYVQENTEDMRWIACDQCDQWFHKHCSNIPDEEYNTIISNNQEWFCSE